MGPRRAIPGHVRILAMLHAMALKLQPAATGLAIAVAGELVDPARLRRSPLAEAVRLLVTDVDERRRASDPRLRQAIRGSTAWWATVRYGKRGRTRAVPLDQDALDEIVARNYGTVRRSVGDVRDLPRRAG
jgi:hypothetical protein